MSFEEKSAWIMGVLAAATYGVYLAVVLGLAGTMPLTEVPYVAPLLWTVGASIAASIVLHIVIRALSRPRTPARRTSGTRRSTASASTSASPSSSSGPWRRCSWPWPSSDHFWIANVIYLAFVLSAILGSVAKIVAYRRGFQPW